MAAMLVLMAQMGSFVPAESLRLGLVDRIYTRIGASDNVARGRSTFMVEMTETATILNTATKRSLILLDEMGRGTATFDGLSLAWATVEYLHAETGARTLFATHYHELTMLAEKLPRVRNLRVGVKEGAGSLLVVGLNGTELSGLERAWRRLVRPGGLILFRRNIKDAQQTRVLLEEATGFCCPRAVRCVDVEGGTVNRLRDALAPIAS